MGTWNSRGLRGSAFEEMINFSIEKYRENGIALIQKIPTPIKPIAIDKKTSTITTAYFDVRSTVDYIGVVQGIPVCFDAKECSVDTFPIQNIHEHQVKFMQDFENQKGISFLIIYYTHRDEMYYLPYKSVKQFYDRSKNGGRKSFTFDEILKEFKIRSYSGVPVHFLEQIQMDIQNH